MLFRQITFLTRNRIYQEVHTKRMEGHMQSGDGSSTHLHQRLRGRVARTRSIGTKLTPDEERKIVAAAEEDGKAPGEWAREILLRATIHRNSEEMERHIFTELVGLQMLLMSTLEPVLCGERLTRDEVAARFRQVQKGKAAQAQELLNRRAQGKEN
jgi:hypothetical protein